jgi:hypothetical protein
MRRRCALTILRVSAHALVQREQGLQLIGHRLITTRDIRQEGLA